MIKGYPTFALQRLIYCIYLCACVCVCVCVPTCFCLVCVSVCLFVWRLCMQLCKHCSFMHVLCMGWTIKKSATRVMVSRLFLCWFRHHTTAYHFWHVWYPRTNVLHVTCNEGWSLTFIEPRIRDSSKDLSNVAKV